MRLGDILRAKAKGDSPRLPPTDDLGWKEEVVSLPVGAIEPNPYQPRDESSAKSSCRSWLRQFNNMGSSIPWSCGRKNRVLNWWSASGGFAACRLLGWERIPAVIRELSDTEVAEIALIENLQREGLSFFEEAEGYRRLLEEFGLTQEELARRLGKSQSAVANKLRLLRFEQPVPRGYFPGNAVRAARHALLRLERAEDQLRALEVIVKRQLNVRETEKLVERMLAEGPEAKDQRKRPSIRGVYKDYRLLRNSVKKLVDQMNADGVMVEFEEVEEGTFVELRIRIHHQDKGGR